MSDMWMAPNIPGLGGTSGFISNGGNAGLTNAQAQYAQNQNYFGNQAQTLAAAQPSQQMLYGPLGFGGATAQAAGTGAAYGRATGGFGGNKMSSVFDNGTAAVPYLSGGGMPFGGGGFSGRGGIAAPPSMAAQQPYQNYGGEGTMGSFSPSTNYSGGRNSIAQSMMQGGGASFADRFGGAPPINSQLQPPSYQGALDAVNQFHGVGTNANLDRSGLPQGHAPPAANEGGESSFADRFGDAPAGGSQFAERFAAGNYFQPGTPSQYYTGDRYPQAQQPPAGYQTLFSADNPGGALPVGGFRR